MSGTKSAPREIVLENSILPKDPGFVRVSTPPRVITLSEHHFPSASEDADLDDEDSHFFEPKTPDLGEGAKKIAKTQNGRRGNQTSQEMVINHRFVKIMTG